MNLGEINFKWKILLAPETGDCFKITYYLQNI